MDIQSLTNEQLLEQLQLHRQRMEEFEARAHRGEAVDYAELRRTMIDLNHLKIQAKVRCLAID